MNKNKQVLFFVFFLFKLQQQYEQSLLTAYLATTYVCMNDYKRMK